MKDLTYAALAHGRCWAVEPQQAYGIWAQLQTIDADAHQLQIMAAAPGGPTKPYEARPDGVAVLYLSGVMTKKGDSLGLGCSSVRLRRAIDVAASDKETKGILIVVDSPGGACAGTQELADSIKAARAKKPVTVFIDDHCFSAAYWVGCCASRIVINQNGQVGYLGTVAALVDSSEAFAMNGLKMLVFSNGELKGAGTPGTEITETQQAFFQKQIDDYGVAFVNTISSGRKMKRDDVRALYTGQIWTAAEAVSNGLVDAIGTLDSAIAEACSVCPDMDDTEDYSDAKAGMVAALALNTISPAAQMAVGSTGPVGAGKTTLPNKGEGDRHPMNFKGLLVRALSAFGLGAMAVAVNNKDSEDPQELAATMAENVKTEVESRLKDNPLVLGLEAHGIKTPADLQAAMAMKALGEKHLAALRGSAKAEAIRAHGPELGATIAAQVDNLPADAVQTLNDSWSAEADAKFDIKNGGGTRKTAPGTKLAGDVETAQEPKSNWEKLTDEQKAHAEKMNIVDEKSREAYAKNVLSKLEGE
jgi:signal peptide peptidase SppA